MSLISSLFSWMPLVAVTASAVLLVVLRSTGGLEGRSFAVLVAWFLGAAGLQFFAPAAAFSLAGLLLQTVLAIYLILRWQLAEL